MYGIKEVMRDLDVIVGLQDLDPVRVHELRDQMYRSVMLSIAEQGESMKKSDVREMIEAALHAEEYVQPVDYLRRLAISGSRRY